MGNRILRALDRTDTPVFSMRKHRDLLADVSDQQLHKALHLLESRGYLQAIERGKYLVLPRAGSGGAWQENPFVVADAIAADPHYLSYWSALSYWNLTTQLPRTVYVVIVEGRPRVLSFQHHQFRFVLRPRAYFYGFEEVEIAAATGAEIFVPFATPEKAILDSLDNENLAGGLPEIIEAVRRGLDMKRLDADRLITEGVRYPTAAVALRLGYLLQRLGFADKLQPLRDRRTRGRPALLRPGAAIQQGPIDRDWNLAINASEGLFADSGS
ncbi:MAG TPA: hypothetical protein VIR57_04320 [Chloroflexota bacterium]